jgi:hypothetical protein
LAYVSINASEIANLTAVKSWPTIINLCAYNCAVNDPTPLVDAAGIGSGDYLYLYTNPFEQACATHAANIAALRARGATVQSACP